jgi:hypothetical protein
LTIQAGLAVAAGVVEVGGEVGRPDVVELVVDAEVEALHVQADAGLVALGLVAVLVVDAGEVEEHLA